jgi:spermidine/putrescine transport system permease protein
MGAQHLLGLATMRMQLLRRPELRVVPALGVFLLFFVVPMAYFFVVSFWRLADYQLVPDFTFHNYVTSYEDYLGAGLFTLAIAATIACIATTLAFVIGYLIRFKARRFGRLVLFVALTTLFGGYLVKIYAWKTILGIDGILNALLVDSGLVDQPIQWLLYSPTAVVLTLVHFLLPFALLPICGALAGISDVPIEAARDLGARPHRVLIDIILPQCLPGLISAFALSFLVSAGDYVTPLLVGGPQTFMVGTFIQSQFINRLDAPVGSALSYSLLAACLIVLFLAQALLRRLLRPR